MVPSSGQRLARQLQGLDFLGVGEVRRQRQEDALGSAEGLVQALEDEAEDGGGVEPMTAGDPFARLAQGGEEIEGGEVRRLAAEPGAGGADDGAAPLQADGQREVASAVVQVEAAGGTEARAVDRAVRLAFNSRPTTLIGASTSLG